ncbi:hypothetical protein M3E13_15255 [Oceanobacillus kimchii]|uniref:DUF6583 family protein n=1 Tax=Oceanobacillus kimchii TaxID=746691 RepID=UPI0021A57235|nr:DUF6583 family protein [Oceanobacillus kimchii]MCT1575623.1 hypothetical protein [Oceanobacillus kimchii]MCT2137254.1 hypothetical protein [Oceanobacillus kimchii]
MEENTNNKSKKGLSKGIIALIVGVIVLLGGTAAAFFINSSSPKATYFLAEKNSLEHAKEYVENRYSDELAWLEKSEEEAMEQNLDIGVTFNEPNSNGLQTDPGIEMINNSRLMFNTQTDMEARQFYTNIGVNYNGIELNDIELAINEGNVTAGLPFLNETLQFNDEDYGSLMYELDPYTFTGNETLNLDSILFDNIYALEEEDLEYIKEEYVMYTYNLLPDEAFESSNEDVEVNGESISAEKVTMHLSEEQAREVLISLFEKMKDDEKLKELVHDQIVNLSYVAGSDMAQLEEEVDLILEDYEAVFEDAIKEIETFQFKDGIQSALWVADDKVVQRELNIALAPEGEQLVTLGINGQQHLTDDQIFFDFEFTADESSSVVLSGDLSSKDSIIKDSMEISIPDAEMKLYYEGEESVSENTRTFDRTFGFSEPYTGEGSMVWSGESTYEEDQMNSNNTLTFGTTEMPEVLVLDMNIDGSIIDHVAEMDTSNIVDIGTMSSEEISTYFSTDFAEQFQQWIMQFMGGSNFEF